MTFEIISQILPDAQTVGNKIVSTTQSFVVLGSEPAGAASAVVKERNLRVFGEE